MNKDKKIKMLEVAKILFLNEVPEEQSKYIGSFIEEQNAEIERLTISLQAQEELTMNEHIKVEKLCSIIKEVREYIMTNGIHSDYGDKGIDDENKLLEILDKENSNEIK